MVVLLRSLMVVQRIDYFPRITIVEHLRILPDVRLFGLAWNNLENNDGET